MGISITTTYPSIFSFLYNVFKNAIQLWILKVVFYIVTCHMSSSHSYVSIKYISFTMLQNTIYFWFYISVREGSYNALSIHQVFYPLFISVLPLEI